MRFHGKESLTVQAKTRFSRDFFLRKPFLICVVRPACQIGSNGPFPDGLLNMFLKGDNWECVKSLENPHTNLAHKRVLIFKMFVCVFLMYRFMIGFYDVSTDTMERT